MLVVFIIIVVIVNLVVSVCLWIVNIGLCVIKYCVGFMFNKVMVSIMIVCCISKCGVLFSIWLCIYKIESFF